MFSSSMQANCDAGSPQEAALWALNAPIPELNSDGLPIFDETMGRLLSVHLWQCGFRHHPECQHRVQSITDDGDVVWTDTKPIESENTNKNISAIVEAAKERGQADIVAMIADKLAGLADSLRGELAE